MKRVPSANDLTAYCGYRPIKFVGTKDHDGAAKSTSDWPLMRAAEVYLNYAEAKAELGTLKQEDLDISINKIRERAKMPDLNLSLIHISYLLSFKGSVKETGIRPPVPVHKERILSGAPTLSLLPHL